MSNGIEEVRTREAVYRSERAWTRLMRRVGIVLPSRMAEARRLSQRAVGLTTTRRRR